MTQRGWRWPWGRLTVSKEESDDTQRRLAEAEMRQAQVDLITKHADYLIKRNHLGENIHKALGGKA